MAQSTQPRNDGGAGTPAKPDAARRTRLRDRTVTFSVSLPKAVFGALFSLFILIWVFIFGIMLGRGHNPEEIVPELASVMPSPPTPEETDGAEAVSEVLSKQDLRFHDALKGQETPQKPKPAAVPPATQTARPQQRLPATAPAAPPAKTQAAKTQAAPAQRKLPVAGQPAPPASPPQGQDQNIYNYIYQVAAFNNTAAAQVMQKKLRDSGLPATISQSESNGVTWYRILVSFTGRPEDTRSLRAKLASHGISAIILRGKTPAK